MNRDIDMAAARAQPGLPGRRAAARQGRTRRVLATAFVMLLPAAVTGAWLRGTVLSTARIAAWTRDRIASGHGADPDQAAG